MRNSRELIRVRDRALFGSATRAPGGDLPWYAEPVTVRKVDQNSTAITVSNSAAETAISTLSLPALTLSADGAARLSASGTIRKDTAGTVQFRLKVADGSSTDTVLATTAITVGTSTDPHPWTLEALLLGKQPNVNMAWGMLDIGTAGAGGTLTPSTYSSVGFSTMGLDESEQWTVTITAQMSAASTAFTTVGQAAILEGVN